MWQRIQTFYLALAVVILVAYPNLTGMLNGDWTTNGFPVALTLAATFLCLLSILQFKNRKQQIKVIGQGMLITLLLVGVVIGTMVVNNTFIPTVTGANGIEKAAGFLFPALALLLQFLAQKGIQKDEALVRSMDRLR